MTLELIRSLGIEDPHVQETMHVATNLRHGVLGSRAEYLGVPNGRTPQEVVLVTLPQGVVSPLLSKSDSILAWNILGTLHVGNNLVQSRR